MWMLVFFPNGASVHLNMNDGKNGQLSLTSQAPRRRISSERWEQIKTARASGIGLREIARNMGIPAGTRLARAKREGWTRQIKSAKALAKREETPPVVAPVESCSDVDAETRRTPP
jgi:hypothetical protein